LGYSVCTCDQYKSVSESPQQAILGERAATDCGCGGGGVATGVLAVVLSGAAAGVELVSAAESAVELPPPPQAPSMPIASRERADRLSICGFLYENRV
jgi:hypothetical protein